MAEKQHHFSRYSNKMWRIHGQKQWILCRQVGYKYIHNNTALAHSADFALYSSPPSAKKNMTTVEHRYQRHRYQRWLATSDRLSLDIWSDFGTSSEYTDYSEISLLATPPIRSNVSLVAVFYSSINQQVCSLANQFNRADIQLLRPRSRPVFLGRCPSLI